MKYTYQDQENTAISSLCSLKQLECSKYSIVKILSHSHEEHGDAELSLAVARALLRAATTTGAWVSQKSSLK